MINRGAFSPIISHTHDFLQLRQKTSRVALRKLQRSIRDYLRRGSARIHLSTFRRWYAAKDLIARHGIATILILFTLAIALLWLIGPIIRLLIAPYLDDKVSASLAALLQSVGSQLIGTCALTFGLVTFAMQANLGRTPHNILARLSTDSRLLAYFLFTFVASVGIALLSLFVTAESAVLVVMIAVVAMCGILAAVILAFLRALQLVNPIFQIDSISGFIRKKIRTWERLSKWAAPLIPTITPVTSFDAARMTFHALNPHWTRGITIGIRQLAAYARQNADIGNSDVSAAALAAVVTINRDYVSAKGRTFIANNPIFPHVNSTDAVINETLEQLRQLSRAAANLESETLLEQTHGCLASLAIAYADIQYGLAQQSKTHAMLAAAYLGDSAKSLLKHDFPDVLMNALQQIGRIGVTLIQQGAFTELTTQVETVSFIGSVAGTRASHRPVLQNAIHEIANFLLLVLQSPRGDIRFACGQIEKAIKALAVVYIQNPDPSPFGASYLAPYFGTTAPNGFGQQLSNLASALAASDEDNQHASRICSNLVIWSEGLYRNFRQLLGAAVAARSNLTFDLIHWNVKVVSALTLASSSRACDDATRDELLGQATWLAAGLTWVPEDAAAIQFAETFSLTEQIVAASTNIYGADRDHSTGVLDALMSWAIRSSPHAPRALQQCLAGIAIAIVAAGETTVPGEVSGEITRQFTQYLRTFPMDVMAFKAAMLETFVDTLPQQYSLDFIDIARRSLDRSRFNDVLRQILAAIPEQS